MPTILGLAGSVRRASFNAALLRAAIEIAPATVTIEAASIAGIPLRPAADIPRVFGGRAVGMIGATPGRGGTILAQAAWLPVLRVLGMRPWFGRTVYVANAGSVFDEDGRLVDDQVRKQLAAFMAGFAGFVIQSSA